MLQVTGLKKAYGSFLSVKGISFQVEVGEIVGLLGQNGAGKSTTMRMISGVEAPTEGEIILFGENIQKMKARERQKLGYLPEIPPLYTDLTVEEHLKVVCDFKGLPRREWKEESLRVAGLLQVEDVFYRCIRHLSKGYCQRVGFAAAIVGKPKLLILDEPAVGLDPKQLFELRKLIRDLSKEMGIILSSHMLTEITAVCHRVIIMKKGEIVANGSEAEVRASFFQGIEIVLELGGDIMDGISRILQGFPTISVNHQGEGRFLLTCSEDLRGEIYRILAQLCPNTILYTLEKKNISMEEVFMALSGEGME